MSATEQREHCIVCIEQPPHHRASPYCRPCGQVVAALQWAAIMAVRKAVRLGQLPRARTLSCVDCGNPALDYEHRDYSKHLSVDPVCRRCNQMRGPAYVSPEMRQSILLGRKAVA